MPGRLARESRLSPRDSRDFFRTPASVTQALLDHELFPRHIWEPACGDGALAEVLKAAGHEVHSSDLYDRGYGITGADFLTCGESLVGPAGAIVTNPPFSLAGEFADRALTFGVRKVALFIRLSFLEGQERGAALFRDRPPCRVWVFSRRQTLWRGDDPKPQSKGGATPFAWAVWERGHRGTQIGWIP